MLQADIAITGPVLPTNGKILKLFKINVSSVTDFQRLNFLLVDKNISYTSSYSLTKGNLKSLCANILTTPCHFVKLNEKKFETRTFWDKASDVAINRIEIAIFRKNRIEIAIFGDGLLTIF
jgi:hypothetical protein